MNLGEVLGVAINSKGTLAVLNHPGSATVGPLYGNASTQIFEFDANGKFVREVGKGVYGLGYGHGIRYDKYDNLWIVDKGTHAVTKFNPAGYVTLNLGRRPEGPDEPEYFKGGRGGGPAPVRDRRLLPRTDRRRLGQRRQHLHQRRLHQLAGRQIRQARQLDRSRGASRGREPGQFNTPHNIAIDRQNNVYVADRGNNRIQVFDRDGTYLRVILLNAPYDKTRHPVLGNLPARAAGRNRRLDAVHHADADAVSLRHRRRTRTPLQADPRRQHRRHARGIRSRARAVQLGARHRLPVGEHHLRRRHEQLARPETDPASMRIAAAGVCAVLVSGCASHVITQPSVRGHMEFLAGDAMNGRGSATRDEWIAAAYIGASAAPLGHRAARRRRRVCAERGAVARTQMTRAAGADRGGLRLTHGKEMIVQGLDRAARVGARCRNSSAARRLPPARRLLMPEGAPPEAQRRSRGAAAVLTHRERAASARAGTCRARVPMFLPGAHRRRCRRTAVCSGPVRRGSRSIGLRMRAMTRARRTATVVSIDASGSEVKSRTWNAVGQLRGPRRGARE